MTMKKLFKTTTALATATAMVMTPLSASAFGGNHNDQEQGQGGFMQSGYESYCITIDDTGDTTGVITGPVGDVGWLAMGTYEVHVELASNGTQIHYWYTNNGSTTQSGYLPISLADGYSATAIQSVENQGTNSQVEQYDNSDVHITLVTIKNNKGEEVEARADGTVFVYDENGTLLSSETIFSNVLVDGKSDYDISPYTYVPAGYTLVSYDTGDPISGIIDGDKNIVIIVEEEVPVESKNVNVKYVDDYGNEVKSSELVYTGDENTTYDVTDKISIPEGYEFVRYEGDSVSGVMDSDKEVIVVVKNIYYYLSIEIQGENGEDLGGNKTLYDYNKAYEVTPESWIPNGYELVEVKGDSVSGIMDSDKTVIIVVKQNTGKYVVNFWLVDGENPKTTKIQDSVYGDIDNKYLLKDDSGNYSNTYVYLGTFDYPDKYDECGNSISFEGAGVRYDKAAKTVSPLFTPSDFMKANSDTIVYDLFFAPKQCNGKVTVHFIDENGDAIATPEEITNRYDMVNGWNYNVDPDDYTINGYTFKEVQEDSAPLTDTVYEAIDRDITLVYTQDMCKAAVKVNFIDKTTGESLCDAYVSTLTWAVAPKDYTQIKPNYKFSNEFVNNTTTIEIASNGIVRYQFEGYYLVETDAENFAPEDMHEYTFTYYLDRVEYNAEITINFEDIFGNKIDESTTVKGGFGYGETWSYEVNPDDYIINGYTYVDHDGDLSVSTETDNEFEVTLIYAPLCNVDVVVNYIDITTGDPIRTADGTSGVVKYEDNFKLDVEIPEIVRYQFAKFDGELKYDFNVTEDFYSEVTLFYAPITQYVRVIDVDGNVLEDYNANYISTDEVFKDAETVDDLVYNTLLDGKIPEGYEFVRYEGDDPEGILDSDKYVDIVVKKRIHNVIITVTDEDGNILNEDEISGNHGDNYEVDTDDYIPDGYELVEVKGEMSGKLDSDTVITMVVKKKEVIKEEPKKDDDDKTETSKKEEPEKVIDNTTTVKTGDSNNTVAVAGTAMLVALAAFVAAIRKRLIRK